MMPRLGYMRIFEKMFAHPHIKVLLNADFSDTTRDRLRSAMDDPYYPIPRPKNAEIYRRYRVLADDLPDVMFIGRLGSYRYYNMDRMVGQALATFDRIARTERGDTRPAPQVAGL